MLRRVPISLLISVAFLIVLELNAQKSTAPNGYYPLGFSGSIFTGSLESVSTDVQELTLSYVKGKKIERFVGKLESTCAWKDKSGAAHLLGVSDFPKGLVLTVFYIPVTSKSGGVKTNENLIFALSYAELSGKRIPDDQRVVIFCSKQQRLQFMAF